MLVSSLLSEFFSTGLALLATICAVSVAIAVLTVRRGLRPLRLASVAAASVDPAHPGLRLPETGLPGEVAPRWSRRGEPGAVLPGERR